MDESFELRLKKSQDLEEAEKRQIRPIPAPKKCDLCSKDLIHEQFYIDGAFGNSSSWANMCPKCYFENGRSIGWGEGQLYFQDKKGSWLLVAGFPPKDKDLIDGSICNSCGEEYPKEDLFETRDGEFVCQECMHNAELIVGQWLDLEKDEDT